MLGDCAAPEVARTSEEAEELALKPLGDSFTKPIGDSILLTCEITGAVENTDYNIKWLGANNREIIERSGRSVITSMRQPLIRTVVLFSNLW